MASQVSGTILATVEWPTLNRYDRLLKLSPVKRVINIRFCHAWRILANMFNIIVIIIVVVTRPMCSQFN